MDKKFIIIIIISILILFYFKKNVENMNKDTYDFSKTYDIDWGNSTPTSTTDTEKPLKKYLESLKKIDSFLQLYENEGLKIKGFNMNVKDLKVDNVENSYALEFDKDLSLNHALLNKIDPNIKIEGNHIAFNVKGSHYGFHQNGNFYHFKNGDRDYRQLNAKQGIDTDFGDDYITTDSKLKLKTVTGWYCDPNDTVNAGFSRASCSANSKRKKYLWLAGSYLNVKNYAPSLNFTTV